MAIIKAEPNQSMMNLVLMACGTLEGAMAFCAANGVSISDNPVVGQEYVVPADIATNKANLQYLKDNKVVLANADLGLCAMPTGVEVKEGTLTSDFVSILYTVPEDAMGMQWGISLQSADVPDAWLELDMEAAQLDVAELTPGTPYRVYVRTVCWGNESKPATVEFTTDTPPPLEYRVVLQPVMDAEPDLLVGPPNDADLYKFNLVGAPEFVNIHEIFPNYPGNNQVYYETEERIVMSLPPQDDTPTVGNPAPDKDVPYELGYTDGLGYMVVWSDLQDTVEHKTIAFQDVEGNEAYYAPVWVFDNVSQSLISKLCAEVVVEVVSATYEQVVIRLTRSHANSIALTGGFGPAVMSWLGDALDGTADPDAPLNPNKVLLTLTPGLYTVGVKTQYTSPRPASAFTMVIEVYGV